MTKEQLRLLEAVSQFNGLLNERLRFFIGGAIKDALVMGRRTAILKEDEALFLQDIVENEILSDVRSCKDVADFLADSYQSDTNGRQKAIAEPPADDITPKKYYEIFIKPALEIISEEYAERIGGLFLKYICTGETPSEVGLTEDEKLLWNVFMAMVEIKFNPNFAYLLEDFKG